ncbi:DUF2505 domain-containing protein [Dietzia sp.]|uniref:DUF2505 domain-containing protein n=1 Tax=Dietzia sp. TaxID=1871616 RepID=UPI002FDA8BB8
MSTSFEFTASTSASVDQVWECYSDAAYWQKRMYAAGSEKDSITSFEAGEDQVKIEFEQVVSGEHIPSFVSKIHSGDLPIERTATYEAPAGGEINAVTSGGALGGVLKVTGTLTVRSEGEKTVEVARGRISASVPLIGKKIEAMVVEYLEQAHDAEVATIDEWIAAQGQ